MNFLSKKNKKRLEICFKKPFSFPRNDTAASVPLIKASFNPATISSLMAMKMDKDIFLYDLSNI